MVWGVGLPERESTAKSNSDFLWRIAGQRSIHPGPKRAEPWNAATCLWRTGNNSYWRANRPAVRTRGARLPAALLCNRRRSILRLSASQQPCHVAFVNMVGPRTISRGHLALAHQIDNLLAIHFGELEAASEFASGLRASANPALVRSRIIKRSNSANTPTICIIARPAELVVSRSSPKERNPAPHLSIRSMMLSRSRSERTGGRASPPPRHPAYRCPCWL